LGTTGTGGSGSDEFDEELFKDENIFHLLFFRVTCFSSRPSTDPLRFSLLLVLSEVVKEAVLFPASELLELIHPLLLLNSRANN